MVGLYTAQENFVICRLLTQTDLETCRKTKIFRFILHFLQENTITIKANFKWKWKIIFIFIPLC